MSYGITCEKLSLCVVKGRLLMTEIKRCKWVNSDPIYIDYHDDVWGRPILAKRELFAKLCLDGQQAGLSWITILKKQRNYYDAFFDFEPTQIVQLSEKQREGLMFNQGIIRNRLKINSIYKNAQGFLKIEQDGYDFADFIWSFVDYKTKVNHWETFEDIPTQTEQSESMSKALKKYGFTFVGPTICYAFMQAVGMVNDHTTDCHCYTHTANLARI